MFITLRGRIRSNWSKEVAILCCQCDVSGETCNVNNSSTKILLYLKKVTHNTLFINLTVYIYYILSCVILHCIDDVMSRIKTVFCAQKDPVLQVMYS